MSVATLSHANGLVEILGLTDLQAKTRSHHLQALKMNSYLLCQFIDLFEADLMRQATAVVTKKVCVTSLQNKPLADASNMSARV